MYGEVFETEPTGSASCYYLSVAEPRKTFRDWMYVRYSLGCRKEN